MAKDIKFSNDIREKIACGVKTLNESVRYTLGPKGRNVIISEEYGMPLIINDGVSIARKIELKDQFENLGAKTLAEASIKTNDLVGDGTTSAIIVGSSLILNGFEKIKMGVNPVILRKGLNHYLSIIIDYINQNSQNIITNKDIYKVAYVSSASDEIATLITNAYEAIGKDGVITLEESQGIETSLVVVNGYSYDRGYLSSYMANSTNMQAELVNPYVLIIDHKITNMNELVPFLEVAIKENRALFIICEDIEQEVLSALVVNKLRGVLNVVCTKAPGFGQKKTSMLKDIALLTNSTFVSSPYQEISTLSNTLLGVAKKVIVSNNETIIMTDSKENIESRINELKEQLLVTTSEYDKDMLQKRISKLSGGIAIIKAGATTELELKEKKLLIEDAICATRAALSSGVIQGGGKIYYEISELLKDQAYNEYLDAKELLITALKQPFNQLVENTGLNLEDVLKQVNKNMWFDANQEKVVDFSNMNVIDPTSVATTVIKNAISVASILLTTECGIVEIAPKKEVNEDNLLWWIIMTKKHYLIKYQNLKTKMLN
mgnify:CR=1 FL=1